MAVTQPPAVLSAQQLAAAFAINTRTIARQVFFLYWHETYHTGQTELLRQLSGTNDKVI